MDEVAQFLSESAADVYPSMKFKKLKDFVKGTVVDVKVRKSESRFNQGEIEKTLLVSLEVSQGRGVVGLKVDEGRAHEQSVNDHKFVTVWVKQGLMTRAVYQAVTDAGAKTIAVGGTLTVAFVDENDTGKGNPAKVYKASYEPPAKSVNVDDFSDIDFANDDDIPFN